MCQAEGAQGAVAVATVGATVARKVQSMDFVQFRSAKTPSLAERLERMLHGLARISRATSVAVLGVLQR
jgi:hypothetical protein